MNDGYTNEFQRALAWSRMTTPIPNDRARALELVAQGKSVVLATYPVYCRITDGLLGSACQIVAVADSREEAMSKIEDDYESTFEVLPAIVQPTVSVTGDEGPF